MVSAGAHLSVWWKCSKNHEWKTAIHNRTIGKTNCPYCCNKRVLAGFNDLLSTHPNLSKTWNYEKNKDLHPTEVTCFSKKKAWWKCDKGHEWEEQIRGMSAGAGCPYCSNRKLLTGYNDLVTRQPKLAKEWNYEKNRNILPNEVTYCSSKKVWWKCRKGHEWEAQIRSREVGGGCPYCSNRRLLVGYNDLLTTDPQLAKEWDSEKNGSLGPQNVMRGSGIKVWWKCTKGHEWITAPNKRTTEQTGCPVCSNKKVLVGYNDLATMRPKLLAEWNTKKNGKVTPQDITMGTSRKVWWICKKGHEWCASPSNRIKNRNCPICSKQLRTSFPEQVIFYYLKKQFDDAANGDKKTIGMELDIYIPSLKTAIEYDGVYFHNSERGLRREQKKNQLCKDKGIRLIRIRERGLCNYGDCECISIDEINDYTSMGNVVSKVLESLGVYNVTIDIAKDASLILGDYLIAEPNNSLRIENEALAKEWHKTKNGLLRPEHIEANSGKKVWWMCKNGHEWQASPHNRMKGKGCPFCSGRNTIIGENDLTIVYPSIIKEWDYEKNKPLRPEQFKAGSNTKVWWKCSKCGYEWRTTITSRTSGNSCPKCGPAIRGLAKRKDRVVFEKELKAINPTITIVGNYTVSTQKVKCSCNTCGNIWEALPGNLLKGKGCPTCARLKRNRKNSI